MSFDQSKSDNVDAVYQKSRPSPSLSSSWSVNKKARVNPTPVNSDSTYATCTVQPQIHGGCDAPVTNAIARPSEQSSTMAVPEAPTSQPSTLSSDPAVPTIPAKGGSDAQVTNAIAKPSEQISTRAVPEAPTSQPAALIFDPAVPTIPAKDDASKNGMAMAIPACTSSAPPNIDEQKWDLTFELEFIDKGVLAQGDAAVAYYDYNEEYLPEPEPEPEPEEKKKVPDSPPLYWDITPWSKFPKWTLAPAPSSTTPPVSPSSPTPPVSPSLTPPVSPARSRCRLEDEIIYQCIMNNRLEK